MAISRVKTWIAAEVLTAATLNAEFDNILNNALSLVSPWTANMAAGGFRLTGLPLGTQSDPSLQFTGDTNTGIYSPGADQISLATGGVFRLRVLANGNVEVFADLLAYRFVALDNSTYYADLANAGISLLIAGRVGIGTITPTASTLLDLTSTTAAFLPPRMTTAQRDALTAINGMIVYNSTTGAMNYYKAGAWTAI